MDSSLACDFRSTCGNIILINVTELVFNGGVGHVNMVLITNRFMTNYSNLLFYYGLINSATNTLLCIDVHLIKANVG